ncbi:MAG: alanine--tRNA ligase, partial [Bacilli bacterium]|nr:alanine--tRNA ligase [Bacilli bacterium]
MRKMTSDEIRDTWLNFFASKGHYIEPSASLVPNNDPTLLWINAGVAALKKYFDGSERPKHRRITNAQKCIRTNDIENVGHTSRHHTFFEMLGNFSIGDYFREEVIPWACELLLDEKYFGFPKEKLYVSYFPDDVETKNLWIKNGMLESHLIPLESNFWEIGEGPCGPDTEIYFDRGEKYDPEHLGEELLRKDMDNDRYIEMWNIVFSQFNSKPGTPRSQYKELPSKNIDTGAGLERFVCVLQDAETNFDTDLFMPYINYVQDRTEKKYEGENKLAYRVIADHIRSVTFALADGAVFSNDGRGYVLRRLVRRASRYASSLGLNTGILSELVEVVASNMSHFYPYLLNEKDRVKKMVLSEEVKFAKTLKLGESKLNEFLEKSGDVLSGEDAFKLSDTYGFPFELTKEIAEEKGKKVDEEGYKEALKNQKERARQARGERESFSSQSKDLLDFVEKSEFTYDPVVIKSKVIGLFKGGVKVDSLDSEGEVVFEKTNFYAESGGQVSDIGFIKNDTCELKVSSVTKAPNKQFLHHVDVLFGEVKVGDEFTLTPDFE